VVQPREIFFVAKEKIFCVTGWRFGGDGLERDFGADAGDVADGNADEMANRIFHGAHFIALANLLFAVQKKR